MSLEGCGGGEDLIAAVVRAVARELDVESHELESREYDSLYDVIDPDALVGLADHARRHPHAEPTVRFEWSDCTVRIEFPHTVTAERRDISMVDGELR